MKIHRLGEVDRTRTARSNEHGSNLKKVKVKIKCNQKKRELDIIMTRIRLKMCCYVIKYRSKHTVKISKKQI